MINIKKKNHSDLIGLFNFESGIILMRTRIEIKSLIL